jgi:hypothetical protein
MAYARSTIAKEAEHQSSHSAGFNSYSEAGASAYVVWISLVEVHRAAWIGVQQSMNESGITSICSIVYLLLDVVQAHVY